MLYSYFVENPKPFFTLVKELYPDNIKPSICHLFVKLLHEKGLLLRNFTQNIDSIELIADVPEEKLVFAHGSFSDAHCISCNESYTQEAVRQVIFNDKIPKCKECSDLVKPRIVFFGESLPSRFDEMRTKDFPKCDLLIIVGTSLKVFPFASLAHCVPDGCPRVLVNMTNNGRVRLENDDQGRVIVNSKLKSFILTPIQI